MWGALAGVGAHLIVASIPITVLFVIQSFSYIDNQLIFFSAFAPAALAGMLIARGRGGRASLIFGAYCTVGMLADITEASRQEEAARACGSGCFVTISAVQTALWQIPAAVGLLLGWILGARRPRFVERTVAPLEAAGAYAASALAVMALVPVFDPRVVPFLSVGLPAERHAALAVFEASVAAIVLAIRARGRVSVRAGVLLIACASFLSVAFADLSTWLHVPLHGWTYWPQSLVLVPVASAGTALVIVTALRATRLVRWT